MALSMAGMKVPPFGRVRTLFPEVHSWPVRRVTSAAKAEDVTDGGSVGTF